MLCSEKKCLDSKIGLPASRARLDYLAGNIRTFGHRWAQLKLVDCRDLIFATEGEFEKGCIRIETKLNVWTNGVI